MRQEAAPACEWEGWVHAAESCDEVVFECLYGPFGSVAAMDVGGNQLVLGIGVVDEVLELLGGFIVESMESWFEAAATQVLVQFLVGSCDLRSMSAFEGFNENGIAVIIVRNHHVLIAIEGCVGKQASLVGVESSYGWLNGLNRDQ